MKLRLALTVLLPASVQAKVTPEGPRGGLRQFHQIHAVFT
jgi:hypothetical protein